MKVAHSIMPALSGVRILEIRLVGVLCRRHRHVQVVLPVAEGSGGDDSLVKGDCASVTLKHDGVTLSCELANRE